MGGKEEMKKIDINKVPVTTFILFLICVVVTAALAGTNYITKPKIAALEAQTQKEAMSVVLPAQSYEDATLSKDGETYTYTVAKNGNEVAGYLITTSANGYGGEIKVMVGVDTKGTITAVKVLSAADETPGLGQKVTKKDFYEKFSGKTVTDAEVDTITGATISSTAVNNAVKKAAEVLSTVINKGEVK